MSPSTNKSSRRVNAWRAVILVAQVLLLGIMPSLGALPATLQGDGMVAHVTEAINQHYNGGVAAATQFKPFYVSGDFNADSATDVLAVVRLKVERSQLPKDVRVVNPFGFSDITRPNQSSSAEGEGVALCLAIMHGGKGSDKVAAKYLLLGGAPLLILDNGRTQPDDVKGLMSVIAASRTRQRRYAEYRIPATARGAWIRVSTQVGDGFIYWDGKTYHFTDSPED